MYSFFLVLVPHAVEYSERDLDKLLVLLLTAFAQISCFPFPPSVWSRLQPVLDFFSGVFRLTLSVHCQISVVWQQFGSFLQGYGIIHWLSTLIHDSSISLAFSLSVCVTLSASQTQGFTATPIVSVAQKSATSIGEAYFTRPRGSTVHYA